MHHHQSLQSRDAFMNVSTEGLPQRANSRTENSRTEKARLDFARRIKK